VEDGKPTIPILEGHQCPKFAGYSLEIRDTSRFYAWKKDSRHVEEQHRAQFTRTIRE